MATNPAAACAYTVEVYAGADPAVRYEPCTAAVIAATTAGAACIEHAGQLLLDTLTVGERTGVVRVTVHRADNPSEGPVLHERIIVSVEYFTGVHIIDARIICGNIDPLNFAGSPVGVVSRGGPKVYACSSHSLAEIHNAEITVTVGMS